jgi:hypothetical protein
VIVVAIHCYLRFGLSYRDVEKLVAERGIEVDHVTVYRWVLRFTPLLVEAARPCRHGVGDRWQVDETYVKVASQWRYAYRAVDQFPQRALELQPVGAEHLAADKGRVGGGPPDDTAEAALHEGRLVALLAGRVEHRLAVGADIGDAGQRSGGDEPLPKPGEVAAMEAALVEGAVR